MLINLLIELRGDQFELAAIGDAEPLAGPLQDRIYRLVGEVPAQVMLH